MNALIVEDNWIISEEIMHALKTSGFNYVHQVDNFTEVRELTLAKVFDLAILDIEIKGPEDGIAVAKHLMGCKPNCYLIFISSYYDRAALEYFDRFNPLGVLNKPFNVSELTKLLRFIS